MEGYEDVVCLATLVARAGRDRVHVKAHPYEKSLPYGKAFDFLVPEVRLELTRLSTKVFETSASANSATRA